MTFIDTITFSDDELAQIEEAYMLSNTPISLLSALRQSSIAQRLFAQIPPEQLRLHIARLAAKSSLSNDEIACLFCLVAVASQNNSSGFGPFLDQLSIQHHFRWLQLFPKVASAAIISHRFYELSPTTLTMAKEDAGEISLTATKFACISPILTDSRSRLDETDVGAVNEHAYLSN